MRRSLYSMFLAVSFFMCVFGQDFSGPKPFSSNSTQQEPQDNGSNLSFSDNQVLGQSSITTTTLSTVPKDDEHDTILALENITESKSMVDNKTEAMANAEEGYVNEVQSKKKTFLLDIIAHMDNVTESSEGEMPDRHTRDVFLNGSVSDAEVNESIQESISESKSVSGIQSRNSTDSGGSHAVGSNQLIVPSLKQALNTNCGGIRTMKCKKEVTKCSLKQKCKKIKDSNPLQMICESVKLMYSPPGVLHPKERILFARVAMKRGRQLLEKELFYDDRLEELIDKLFYEIMSSKLQRMTLANIYVRRCGKDE